MEKVLKISFLGDVTCDRPMLRAAQQADGSFDFDRSFENLRPLFSESDLVVGNFETVCAGAELGYNPGAVTYNSPDELVAALKRAGINMLTTANNHTLDCGVEGLYRTLDILDTNNILHTGAVRNPAAPACERYEIFEKNGIRVAIVALTATMNRKVSGKNFSDAEWNSVNELRSSAPAQSKSAKQMLKRLLPMKLINELKASINRMRGIPLISTYADNYEMTQGDLAQLARAKEILKHAGENADFVVACVHSGGQFNAEPGSFSRRLYEELEPLADAIVGNHPHVVQKMIRGSHNRPIAYSLGSLNMSQSSDYVNKENAPEFSIMLDLHLEKKADGSVELSRTCFTLLHAQEDENAYLTVSPWDEKHADEGKTLRAMMVVQRFDAPA